MKKKSPPPPPLTEKEIMEIKRQGQAQRAKQLRDAAAAIDHTTPQGWTKEEGVHMAMRYRKEADDIEAAPIRYRKETEKPDIKTDFNSGMPQDLNRYFQIAQIDPAKLAFRERQQMLGKRDRPKPWHKRAIEIIEEHANAPNLGPLTGSQTNWTSGAQNFPAYQNRVLLAKTL